MKMNKLAILAGGLLTAASLFADVSFATVTTVGAKGETSAPNWDFYSAYLCTVAAAGTFFGGNSGYADITGYLSDSAHYADGVAQIAAGGIGLGSYEYDLGELSFDKYFDTELASGDYIALATYENGDEKYFRVFENSAEGGTLVLDPANGDGYAGAWTPVGSSEPGPGPGPGPSPTPEPTSGLLVLLGLAGLALRRGRA